MHLILLVWVFVSSALADVKRLSVLEFQGDDVEDSVLSKLSDQTRIAAVQMLPPEQYLIMTRENMMQILSDMGKDASCLTGACEVELGRNVGADFIVTGNLSQMEGTYILTINLYTTDTGALLNSIEVQDSSLLNLKNKTQSRSRALFAKGLGLSGPSSKAQDTTTPSGFHGAEEEDWEMTSGMVHFRSDPEGAIVLVDGDLLCSSTPCSKEISTGLHDLSIQKDQYHAHKETVYLENGQTVAIELRPNFGLLDVAADIDGVEISLDGEPIGTLPLKHVKVVPGAHTISIEDPCYQGKKYTFEMTAGQREIVDDYPVAHRSAGINVRVLSDAGDSISADIYVDGQAFGQSPLMEKVPLCSKEIEAFVGEMHLRESLRLQEKVTTTIELFVDSLVADDGSVYEGSYLEGKRHGIGILRMSDGTVYEGQFEAGQIQGSGVQTQFDGTVYEGQFHNGRFQGQGTLSKLNGMNYSGGFQSGEYHGDGVLEYANGDVYKGQFQDGKYHGQGEMSWAKGQHYIGEWRNGMIHGQGTYTLNTGKKLTGTWVDGKLQK